MLIAIVGLALVAVFMAQKRNAADDQQDLPAPGGVPSQGSSGVPSPGPEETGNPVGTTHAGRLAAYATAGMVKTPLTMNKRTLTEAAIGNTNISDMPQGPPTQEKSLSTAATSPLVSLAGSTINGYRRV